MAVGFEVFGADITAVATVCMRAAIAQEPAATLTGIADGSAKLTSAATRALPGARAAGFRGTVPPAPGWV